MKSAAFVVWLFASSALFASNFGLFVVWIALSVLILYGHRSFSKRSVKSAESQAKTMAGASPRTAAGTSFPMSKAEPFRAPSLPPRVASDEDRFYVTPESTGESSTEYLIDRQPAISLAVSWIGEGGSITIHGRTLTDPCVWVSAAMPFAGQTERGVIYSELAVRQSDEEIRPQLVLHDRDYFGFTREQRADYLDWLIAGANHAPRDPAFAFEYFCGLERYAIQQFSARHPDEAQLVCVDSKLKDLSAALSNARSRGLDQTGATVSLGLTIAKLSQLVQLRLGRKKFYEQEFLLTNARWEVPLDLRIALGQLAREGVAMPAPIALAWFWYAVPSRSAVIERCQVEFARLFKARFARSFPSGFQLRVNQTPLEISYYPSGSRHQSDPVGLWHLPDVTAQKKPIEQLAVFAQTVVEELTPLSRLLAKEPAARKSIAMIACSPVEAWPSELVERITELRARVGEGVLAISWGELQSHFGSAHDLSPARFASFSQNLEAAGLIVIRHVAHKWPVPCDEDSVVLVADSSQATETLDPNEFTTALLAVYVGAWLAHQDSRVEAAEIRSLHGMIAQWPALASGQARRLKGQLRTLMDAAPSISHIKQSAKTLDRSDVERAVLSALGSLYRQRDCTPEEMRRLQAIYTAIGLPTDLAIAHLHRVQAGETARSPHSVSLEERGESSLQNQRSQGAVFRLNPHLVAAKQQESATVAAMLHEVFAEPVEDFRSIEVRQAVTSPTPHIHSDSPSAARTVLASHLPNLDPKTFSFAHALADSKRWSRSALVTLAQTHGVMLDGALEAINDAAFEQHDFPFGEGEDPFELSPEFLVLLNADSP